MEGIVEIAGVNAVWMDPVAVLSSSYSDYDVSHSRYYSRSSLDNRNCNTVAPINEGVDKRTRKRKRKKTYAPNEKEILAELRHEEARFAILNAHSFFLATTFVQISSRLTVDSCCTKNSAEPAESSSLSTHGSEECFLDFRQLAQVWQAPMYELNIFKRSSESTMDGVFDEGGQERVSNAYRLFNSFIEHEDEEAIAECAGALFVLPRHCRFLTSDVTEAHQLIPRRNIDKLNPGYNLIVIDPPWENKSVRRNSLYPMMPNRQLFSLPVKQLAHSEGALVALWLTNREKLHQFVEKELFPAWGVKLAATWYWLKLNTSGKMISPLDLQHHKPYECLLLGYLFGPSAIESAQEEATPKGRDNGQTSPPEKFVVMSVPGDHSRKPPMGSLLAQYAPGPHPINGLELFARELNSGWTSWGNEPLHFQNLKYFQSNA